MKTDKLGNIIKLTKGKKHLETDDNSAIRYLQIEDLNGNAANKYTYETGVLVNTDDIIIAWDGANAGKVGTGLTGIIGSTLARMVINQEFAYTKFLYWFLNSKFDLIKSQRTGATIPHISNSALRNLSVPLPPLEIQKKIAAILDKADELRQNDKKILEKYDQLAQSVFQEMFGDPEKNEKKWPLNRLDQLCKKITDGTHQSPKFKNEGIPFLFVSNIQNNSINYDTNKYISEEEYLTLTKSTPIEVGDLLLTIVGSIGNPAIVTNPKRFCFQRHIAHLKPNKELINIYFLHAVLQTQFVKRQIYILARGVAQKTLNLKELKSIEIIYPPLHEQNKFENIIHQIGIQRHLSEISMNKSHDLFQSLLQRAFKGELG
ncbi:MAG TPA: restriction endonuclease subunit S [Bacteroidales bacterium]|nr:restriction endonuclease subunit S [Bacteroidales bacterium]